MGGGYPVSVVPENQLHLPERLRLPTNVVDHLGRQPDFGQTVQFLYDGLRLQADRDSAV